jgi:predicted RNase H-like nuclease
MPRFIGIDLAWSGKHPSGLAALEYDPSAQTTSLLPLPSETELTDDQIIAFVKQMAGDAHTVIVAIDAPLAVPNLTGRRSAEARLSLAFHSFQAGAHPANRQRLGAYNGGEVRGEVIVRRLNALGIRHTPLISPRQPTRQVFEVYPHPAMVVLFGLSRTLKYKRRGPGRLDAFREYQSHLRSLRTALPILCLPESLNLLSEKNLEQRGAKLKAYEDQLDAVFCAYIGLYYWYWGIERCHVFADSADDYAKGYIVSPIDKRIKILADQ